MSFLLLDDLDQTLADVLAFIDDFTSSESDHSSLTSSSNDPISDPSDVLYRRKKSQAAASRRFQQKKKAELLALRAQVATLQKRLKELQENGSEKWANKTLDETQKRNLVTTWLTRVEVEKHLRVIAETQNRELKFVLKRQKRVARVVRHVLQNVTMVVHIEEGLRTPHPSSTFGHFVPNLDDAIYSELMSRIGNMYLDVDNVFSTSEMPLARSITDTVEVQWDSKTGMPYVELRATLVVHLSVKETADVAQHAKPYDPSRYKKHCVTEIGLKKELEVDLSMTKCVSVMTLARKFEEKDHILNMWTSLVCEDPLDTSVRFREQGWIQIKASPSKRHSSVVRTCYRLFPDIQSGAVYTSSGHDADVMAILVLEKLGEVTRRSFVNMGAVYANGTR